MWQINFLKDFTVLDSKIFFNRLSNNYQVYNISCLWPEWPVANIVRGTYEMKGRNLGQVNVKCERSRFCAFKAVLNNLVDKRKSIVIVNIQKNFLSRVFSKSNMYNQEKYIFLLSSAQAPFQLSWN